MEIDVPEQRITEMLNAQRKRPPVAIDFHASVAGNITSAVGLRLERTPVEMKRICDDRCGARIDDVPTVRVAASAAGN